MCTHECDAEIIQYEYNVVNHFNTLLICSYPLSYLTNISYPKGRDRETNDKPGPRGKHWHGWKCQINLNFGTDFNFYAFFTLCYLSVLLSAVL